jgi:phosphoribosylanthranilate isomerase
MIAASGQSDRDPRIGWFPVGLTNCKYSLLAAGSIAFWPVAGFLYNRRMAVRIKICGITRLEDAAHAARLGADAIGLNFSPRSARRVDEEQAARIALSLPPFVEPVGLFVNDPLEQVVEKARRLGFLRTIQWHGDKHEVPPAMPFSFIPAFQVRDRDGLAAVSRYLERCREDASMPAAVLIDGHLDGEYGGTGRTAPWQLLADFDPGVPVILAGGLTPENVAEAIRLARPYAVDVASGVEAAPGQKDLEKMRRFIANVRAI